MRTTNYYNRMNRTCQSHFEGALRLSYERWILNCAKCININSQWQMFIRFEAAKPCVYALYSLY